MYLKSQGDARTRNGTGVLTFTEPVVETHDRFVYDPAKPVPTLGGNMCCNDSSVNEMLKPGVFDQSELELRKDILVYTSRPLEHDITVIGPVVVKFWAASTAPDTDFTAKLVDVRPDGFSPNILDRIINARLRMGSKTTPSPIQPGKPYSYRIDLGDTAIVLRAGHRLRLELSSSNFPHFARNPNTGRGPAVEGTFVTATQTVMHGGPHPSFIELPIVNLTKH
jgi:putative CocE/NonD family hydrolase